MCLQIIYIQYACINRILYYITYNGWYAINLTNQPTFILINALGANVLI